MEKAEIIIEAGNVPDDLAKYFELIDHWKPDVWTIATQPFPDAHFATFPEKLVKPMILAGTSEYGCCSAKIKKLRLREDLTDAEHKKVILYLQRRKLV